MSLLKKAIVKSYDAATHKATVQIAGSLSVWLEGVRVATDIPAGDVVVGRQCSVLFLDPSNQDEAVVATIQGALPSGGGAALNGAPPPNQDSSSAGVATTAQRSDHHHECFVRALANFGAVVWHIPGWYYAGFSTTVPMPGVLHYIPIYVPRTTTYTGIGITVITPAPAGKLARLGIYNNSLGTPSTLVLDAGTVPVDTTGDKIITINQQLAAGHYWLAYVSDHAPTLGSPSTAGAISPATTGFSGGGVMGGNNTVVSASGRLGDVAGGLVSPAPTPTASQSTSRAAVALRG